MLEPKSYPLGQTQLNSLMAATAGNPAIAIGIIDGPTDLSHPDLQKARIQELSNADCEAIDSLACLHGTFTAGMLAADRSSQAPALCPDCTFILRPIFCETGRDRPPCPEVTPEQLAEALQETLNAGANIVNLSLGLSAPRLLSAPELQKTFERARRLGALVVAASGNLKQIGPVPLFDHPWVIPVAACDRLGRITPGSNTGLSVGRRGLMAPGQQIVSTAPGGGYTATSGTSTAAPFVTGAIALLWSLYPNASAAEIRRAILRPDIRRGSIAPPPLDARASWQQLEQSYVQ